mmetsp:Transcript_53370/g.72940  ORF Transcript_53370/g.72940 Transcript_53370/m.72940 type:complete len:548 (-) Transcript_53370:307-1950(-)
MVCLGDLEILCGRQVNACMINHVERDDVPCKIALSFLDLSVWDYTQEAYLDTFNVPAIQPHFSCLHKLKFGTAPDFPSSAVSPPGGNDVVVLEVLPPPIVTSSNEPMPPGDVDGGVTPPAMHSHAPACVLEALTLLNVVPVAVESRLNPFWNRYSMLSSLNCNHRSALLELVTPGSDLDRAVGAMLGMPIGDAVGAPLEFLDAADPSDHSPPLFDVNTMTYSNTLNRFQLKRGQWTDDASMGFCMADSLLANKETAFDGSDIRVRFHLWWNHGYCNAFRKDPDRSGSVGLGGNISLSLAACRPGQVPPPVFQRESQDAGNGSLMRLAPVPIRWHNRVDKAMSYAALSSLTTHPGPLAAACCEFLAHVICNGIHRTTRPDSTARSFLEHVVEEHVAYLDQKLNRLKATDVSEVHALGEMKRLLLSDEPQGSLERNWNWRSDSLALGPTILKRGRRYNGYPNSAGYFGSFSFDGLAMALWSVYHTQTFGTAIEKCVNLLGDADTTGAIAGQIAGAFYGYSGIDDEFVKNLTRWDDGDAAIRAILLYYLP